MHGGTGPDRRHFQALDVKFQWQLARSQSINDQLCIVTDKPIHNDLYLSTLRPHVLHLAALFPGRQIQLQSFCIYRVDMLSSAKKVQNSHAKAEFCNTNDRLNSRLVIVGICVSKNSEAGARNLEPLEQRDMEGVKLNLALESSRQSLNHSCTQGRLVAVDHNARYGDRNN
jgi:hypothetical protein